MTNFLPLLVLLFVSKNVYSLECYVTDLRTLGVNSKPTVQNCLTYVKSLGQNLNPGHDFRCGTVTAESDETRVNIQMCLTRADNCDDIKRHIRTKESLLNIKLNSLSCKECRKDLCNSGVVQTIELKNEEYGGALMWLFVISMIVVFGIVVTVMITWRRPKKNESLTKV